MEKDRQIEIKNAYCKLIVDLGFDYDGYNSVEGLKSLIDTLVDYAQKAITDDDVSVVYVGNDGHKENILMEKLGV